MLRTSSLDPYHALHMTDFYLSGKIQLSSQAMSKTSSGSVKSIPKDFSDADPVEVNPRLSSGSVKSTLRFF